MRKALVMTAVALGSLTPLPALAAQGDGVDALDRLERGEWELRERGAGGAVRRLCIGDPLQLLQPRHPGQMCRRFVLEDAADRVSVTYDCAHAGQGRTALRVETARLVQIDSQGVSGGAPFAMMIEGRRVGACGPTAMRR